MPCIVCGKSFTAETKQSKKIFKCCSTSCAGRLGAAGKWSQAGRLEMICMHCGTAFKPKTADAVTFCSRACNYAHKAAQPKSVSMPNSFTCKHCRTPFTSILKGKLFCSQDCSRLHSLERAKRKLRARPAVTKRCANCNREFSAVLHPEKVFCSKRCSQASARRTRKAKERHYEYKRKYRKAIATWPCERIRLAILRDRDKGMCWLCDKPVEDVAVPHPSAPTIDHVIPIAKGGQHLYSNVRLAHFICNSVRGANV
jgi:5-methylcytosine-specific restriction endonuclease McrA